MTETIHQQLVELYGPEEGQSTYEALIQIIERKRVSIRQGVDPGPLFDEKDVVLITYGDTLQQPGASPLHILEKFATEYLHDTLSTIHVLPFYPYSSDDGFSVIDYFAVNPRLGTWQDIARLGERFDLMFDAVINHMSAQSEWFRQFLAEEPGFQDAFIAIDPATDLSSVTRPRTSPLLTPFQRPDDETVYVWTTFSADQVDLNYKDPATLLRILDVLLFYVEKGARIIRLDAIAYIWKEIGTPSIHQPEAHLIVQVIRAALDLVAPYVILITETNVPHAENIAYFGDGENEAQLVYNFTLPPLLLHTFLSGDATRLHHWVNTLHTPSAQTTFFNFTASHDGIGVRPVEDILTEEELAMMISQVEAHGGHVSYKTNSDGTQSPYELNITYIDALCDPQEPQNIQVRRFLASQAIMLALAGMPAIYIHSLLGSRNDFEGVERTGYNRSINRAKLQSDEVLGQIAAEDSFRAQIFQGCLNLVRTRIAHSAFHPNAAQRALSVGTSAVFALLRQSETMQVLALHNVSEVEQTINLGEFCRNECVDLLTSATLPARNHTMAPYEVRWLALRQA